MISVRALLRELQRRRVARTAALYAVVGWVVFEVTEAVVPALLLPDMVTRLVLFLILLGFPFAVALAWAYDVTPEGVRRTEPAQWQRVQELLAEAIALPPSERPGFLRRATADDDALRRELQTLLTAHERQGPLDRPIGDWLEAVPRSDPVVGTTVGRYRVLEKLGGGGMGIVYSARDERLDRRVALKFLPPHLSARDEAKQRFVIEAQAAAALEHPNICTVHEIGETVGGQLYIAMPLYDGETLKQRITRGPVPIQEAVDVTVQAARGLAKAHERGIVHRDVKPANLILTRDGVLKIVDFGIAKLADVTITRPDQAHGTIAYMSPEHARGDPVDGRSDLWSLGVVLYEMLTGERPFRGATDLVVLAAIETAPVTIPPLDDDDDDVPVSRILRRMLAKEPEHRHGHASELIRELERWVAERARSARERSGAADAAEGGEGRVDRILLDDGERRPATALVAMLSGYAGLVERLGPDQLTAAMERIRSAADEIATRNGGVLNEFREDELMLLFGVPIAHEDHSVRAVRAAIELHERVRGMRHERRDANPDVRLHTGIDQGPIVARPAEGLGWRYLVAGEPVHLARRLAIAAAPDEIWISPDCHRAVGPFFDTEPRPRVASSARGEPIAPRRVVRHTGIRSRLEAAVRTGLTRYVGRDRELGRLEEAWTTALKEGGRLVVVTGEAGLGKSRLLHEFHRRAVDGPARQYVGRCHAHGGNTAYLPFAEILRACLGLDEGGSPAEAPERIAKRAAAIAPELTEFVPLYLHLLDVESPDHPVSAHLHGDQLRVALQEATAALLVLSARATPLVLLLEDWHWADDASQTVLEQIMEVAAAEPLLVVVTSRTPLTWQGQGRHEVVPLEPLGADSSVAMLRSIAGVEDFDASIAELLHARTGGNPFFLEEICHALLEEGTLQVDRGTVRLNGPVDALQLPDTVHAVIHTRLERLERESRGLVRLASVIGREFSRGILERATPSSGRLPNALQTLKAAGLIQQVRVLPEAVYRFKHVLTQEVAYDSLLGHQRRELHGRVAAAIEDHHRGRLQDQLQQLAHHHRRADHWLEAIDYGVRAADRLHSLSEFPEALQQLERCEEWLEHSPIDAVSLEIDILLRQERLCETVGMRARQQELIDRLIALLEPSDDRPRLAEVYLRQGDLFTLLRSFERAEVALESSLRIWRELGDAVGERSAIRSLGLMCWHDGRHDDALRLLDAALRLDRERRDVSGIVGDLVGKGAVLKAKGDLEGARLALEEALDLSERELAVDRELPGGLKLPYILHTLANVYREMGDSEGALRMLRDSLAIAEHKHLPIQASYHGTAIAHILLQRGEVEESVEAYRMAVGAARRARFTPGLSQSLSAMGEVLLGLGRPTEALPHLEEARGLFMQLRDAAGELRTLEAMARALGRTGADPAGAYEAALALACAIPDAEAEVRIRNSLGIIAWSRADYDRALDEYQGALRILRDSPDAAALGLVLNSIAATLLRQSRHEEAEPVLREALELHRREGHELLEAHAETFIGEVEEARGELEAARRRYERSLAVRNRLGDTSGVGWTLHRLARVAVGLGASAEAADLTERARLAAVECGDGELRAACEATALVHE